jgi:hypothetical protein
MRSKPSSARTNRRPLSCVAAPCSGHLVCDDLDRATGLSLAHAFSRGGRQLRAARTEARLIAQYAEAAVMPVLC